MNPPPPPNEPAGQERQGWNAGASAEGAPNSSSASPALPVTTNPFSASAGSTPPVYPVSGQSQQPPSDVSKPTELSNSNVINSARPSIWEVQAERLKAGGITSEDQVAILCELRDRVIETALATTVVEYPAFLEHLLPVFELVLQTVPVQSLESMQHKIRHSIIDMLERLLPSETLKPYKDRLLTLALEIVRKDNEENAVLGAKILSNLFKAYRGKLENHVEPCFLLVMDMYRLLPEAVTEAFAPSSASALEEQQEEEESTRGMAAASPTLDRLSSEGSAPGHGSGQSDRRKGPLPLGMKSFKVLVECPFLIMVLSSYYPSVQQHPWVADLIELAIKGLELRPPEKAALKQRVLFREFLALQIKTVNFLSWNRQHAKLLVPYQDTMIASAVWLLQNCPGEFASNRKELLTAMRYMIQSEMREGFLVHVDVLLDEATLEGIPPSSLTSSSSTSSAGRPHDALRTSSLNMLSELVSPLREKLSTQQLSAVVYLFSKHVHDPTLPLATQTLAVRVLLHLVDSICRNASSEEGLQQGRRLLVWILQSLVEKFGSLRAYLPKLEAQERVKAMEQEVHDQGALRQLPSPSPASSASSPFHRPFSSPMPYTAGNLSTSVTAATPSMNANPGSIAFRKPNPAVIERVERVEMNENLRAGKDLIKTMMVGLKTVIWCLLNPQQATARAQGQPAPVGLHASSPPLPAEETALLVNFFEWALLCLRIYSKATGSTGPEAKEIFELFVGALLVMEAPTLREVMGRNLELYFNVVLQDFHFLAIAQQLVSSNNAAVSASVADMLVHFFLAHIELLSGEDDGSCRPIPVFPLPSFTPDNPSSASPTSHASTVASTLFRMFSVALHSIAKFSDNEIILRPHLKRLVLLCQRNALCCRHPSQYLSVLRVLFRIISGGKLDALMREMFPLLPHLLFGFYKLHERTEDDTDDHVRDLLVELSLTVPARLSSMVPFVALLMRMIVQALRSKPELAHIGLRTLEFWVDNLNVDYLWHILSQQPTILSDLFAALCEHLRPQPYPYGHLAARLLGKLGGRNRSFLKEAPPPLPSLNMQVKKGRAGIGGGKAGIGMGGGLLETQNGEEGLIVPPSIFDVSTNEASFGNEEDGHMQEVLLPLLFDWNKKEGEKEAPPFALPLDRCICTITSLLDRLLLPSSPPKLNFDEESETRIANEIDGGNEMSLVSTNFLSSDVLLQKHKDAAWKVIVACVAALIVEDASELVFPDPDGAVKARKRTVQDRFAELLHSSLPPPPLSRPPSSNSPSTEEGKKEDGTVNDGKTVDTSLLFSTIKTRRCLEKGNKLLRQLLSVVVSACADVHLGAQARKLARGLGIHFLLVMATHTEKLKKAVGNTEKDEKEEDMQLENMPGQAPEETSAEYELDPLVSEASLNPLVLKEVILLALVDARPSVQDAALWFLNSLAAPSTTLPVHRHSLNPFFDDLLSSTLRCLYLKRVRSKLGAAKGVKILCEAMGTEWTRRHELQVVKDLFFVLKDQPYDASAPVVEDIISVLLSLLTLCHTHEEEEGEAERGKKMKEKEEMLRQIVNLVVQDLENGKPAVRVGVKVVLAHLDELHSKSRKVEGSTNEMMTVYEMLVDGKDALLKRLLEKKAHHINTSKIALIDAFTFCLRTTQEPVVPSMAIAPPPAQAPPHVGAADEEKKEIESPMPAASTSVQKKKRTDLPTMVREAAEALQKEKEEQLRREEKRLFAYPIVQLSTELMKHLVDVFDSSCREDIGATGGGNAVSGPQGGNIAAMTDDRGRGRGGAYDITPRKYLEAQSKMSEHVNDMFMVGELPHVMQLRFYTLRLVAATFRNKHEIAFSEEFKDFRQRVVVLCFRTIIMQCDPVADVALETLTLLTSINKNLPKETLHNCLRPVLKSVQDYRLLSVASLEGLLRILASLSNLSSRLFNVNFPEKLLEHLQNWTEPEDKILSEVRVGINGAERPPIWMEPEIAASILHLFHLIEPSPVFCEKFLAPLVQVTIALQNVLPKYRYNYPSAPAENAAAYIQRAMAIAAAAPLPLTTGAAATAAAVAAAQKKEGNESVEMNIPEEGEEGFVAASPFIVPLAKFLNRFVAEPDCSDQVIAFFLEPRQLASAPTLQLLTNVLQTPDAEDFRSLFLSAPGLHSLLTIAFGLEGVHLYGEVTNEGLPEWPLLKPQKDTWTVEKLKEERKQHDTGLLVNHGLILLSTLLRMEGDKGDADTGGLLGTGSTPVMQALRYLWSLHRTSSPSYYGAPTTHPPSVLDVAHTRAQTDQILILKCLLQYSKTHPKDCQGLVSLLEIFTRPTFTDLTFLRDFFRKDLALDASADTKRSILSSFVFEIIPSPHYSSQLKILTLRHLILPLLAATFESPAIANGEVVESAVIDGLIQHAFHPIHFDASLGGMKEHTFKEGSPMLYSNGLLVELHKLATLLIEYMGREFMGHKKEMLKFAWSFLKREDDSLLRHWAYIHVCRLIQVYEILPPLILQVYLFLLKAYQQDTRELVRTALEILVPALPRRLPLPDYQKAVRYTKRALFEDGLHTFQMAHLAHVLVQHPPLFYPYRSSFVPPLITCVQKLSQPSVITTDVRQLGVALSDLLIAWEIHRRERVAAAVATSGAGVATGTTVTKGAGVGVGNKRPASSDMDVSSPVAEGAGGESNKRGKADSGSPFNPAVSSPAAAPVPPSSTTSAGSSSSGVSTTTTNHDDDSVPVFGHVTQMEAVLNFLIKNAIATADSRDPQSARVSARSLHYIGSALSLWACPELRLPYLERVLSSMPETIPSTSVPSSSGVAQQGGKEITPQILICVLDILLAVLEHGPQPAPFVSQNVGRVAHFLVPCFNACSGESEIRKRLTRVLALITKWWPPHDPSPEFLEPGSGGVPGVSFYVRMKTIMEKKIYQAIETDSAGGNKTGGLGPQQQQQQQHQQQQKDTGRCSAFPIVQILGTIVKQASASAVTKISSDGGIVEKGSGTMAPSAVPNINQAVLEPYCSMLLKLATHLTRHHTANALINARPGIAQLQFMATPTMAILDEALSTATSTATTVSIASSSGNASPSSGASSVMKPPDEAIQTLIRCIQLTGRCIGANPMRLADQRKALLAVMGACLDKSDSIPLLLAIYHLVAEWTLGYSLRTIVEQEDNDNRAADKEKVEDEIYEEEIDVNLRAVLQQKEKAALLAKMSLALERSPEVVSQPLHAVHHRFVLLFLQQQQQQAQPNVAPAPLRTEVVDSAGLTGASPSVASAAPAPADMDVETTAATKTQGAASTILPSPATGQNGEAGATEISSTSLPGAPGAVPGATVHFSSATPSSVPVAPAKLSAGPVPQWVTQATARSVTAGLITVDYRLREQYTRMFYDPHIGMQEGGVSTHPGKRLTHLLCKAEWDVVGGRYWIVVLVDLLLRALFPNSASLQPVNPSLILARPRLAAAEGGTRTSSDVVRFYLETQGELKTSKEGLGPSIIAALRLLLHADLTVVRGLWIPLLRNAWKALKPVSSPPSATSTDPPSMPVSPSTDSGTPDESFNALQNDLVPGMVSVLTRGSHRQALVLPSYHLSPVQHQINTVQGLLHGFLSLRPMPNLPPDLLGALAVNYNAWTTVLPLIEHQVTSVTGSAEKQPWIQVLSTLYYMMGEHDLRAAMRKRFCALPESKYALSLEMYGKVLEAQQAFYELIQRDALGGRGGGAGGGVGGTTSFRGLAQFELELWEERWIECSKQLSQWPTLGEFAASTKHPELALECAWKSADWESVRSLLQSNQLILQQETGSPAHRVHEARLAVADGRPPVDIDRSIGQAFQLALSKWQLLPRVYQGCPSHKPLLHVMHQLHEIKESVTIMDDAAMKRTPGVVRDGGSGGGLGGPSPGAASATATHLHNLVRFWRDRLPNTWDPLNEWDDVLYWRLQVFQKVQERRLAAAGGDLAAAAAMNSSGAGMGPDPSRLAPEFQDTAWTMVTLAKGARKQELNDVALNVLCRIPMATMAVSDAYGKLREQVMICYHALRVVGSLGSMASDYLSGILPAAVSNAGQGSVPLTPSKLGQAGLNIINHTNIEYFEDEQTAELFRLKGLLLGAADLRADANQAFSHAVQVCEKYGKAWLAWGRYSDELFEKETAQRLLALNAMACYLEAIHHNALGARLLLSRVLQMLLVDEESAALVLDRHGRRLPDWIWVPWIPTLIAFLTRPGAHVVKGILKQVTNSYPQAVYCTIRAYFIERRDLQSSLLPPSTQSTTSVTSSAPAASTRSGTLSSADAGVASNTEKAVIAPSIANGAATTDDQKVPQSSTALAGLPPQLAACVDLATGNLTQPVILRYSSQPGPSLATPQQQPGTSLVAQTVKVEAGRPVAEVRGALDKGAILLNLPPPSAPAASESVAGGGVSGGGGATPAPIQEVGAFQHAEEVVNQFRKSHPSLAHDMELMLEEIIVRFRPKQEEELLGTLHTLLRRCFQSIYMHLDDPMPHSLRETLLRVSKKFFRSSGLYLPSTSPSSPVLAENSVSAKKAAFVKTFKDAFEKDFMLVPPFAPAPPAEGHPAPVEPMSLHRVILTLRKWKQLLLYCILKDQHTAGGTSPVEQPLALYQCSPHLAAMRYEIPPSVLRTSALSTSGSSSSSGGGSGSSAAEAAMKMGLSGSSAVTTTPVEIPGQYATCPGQPFPDMHAKLLGFDPKVEVFYRNHAFHRRLCLLGNDGRKYYFVAQGATPYTTRSDERMMQLYWLLNRLLEKSNMAQRRSIAVSIPVVVPITPRLRLMEDHRLFTSLGEVYEAERHAKGLDPDGPVMLRRERGSVAISLAKQEVDAEVAAEQARHTIAVQEATNAGLPVPPAPVAQSSAYQTKIEKYLRRERLAVFQEVTRPGGLVSKHILTQFVHSTLGGEPEAIWSWKHTFAQQLAVSSLFCFALSCGERTPGRLIFHKLNATIQSADLRPGYGIRGYLESNEEVPFRLSPNLMAVFSPFLVDGVFVPTMAAVAQAMTQKREFIQPFLHLMLKDDILAWNMSKATMPREAMLDQKKMESVLADRVNRNVLKVLERLVVCAPALPSEKHPFVSPLQHGAGTGGMSSSMATIGAGGEMIDARATLLVERAAKHEYVAQMAPTWHPWL